jgi:hypothetical protein
MKSWPDRKAHLLFWNGSSQLGFLPGIERSAPILCELSKDIVGRYIKKAAPKEEIPRSGTTWPY